MEQTFNENPARLRGQTLNGAISQEMINGIELPFLNEHFKSQFRAYPVSTSALNKRSNQTFKRIFDICISTLVILLILPWLLPLLALLIKLDSKGPVFFRQRRSKRGNAWFTCIKLRTMKVNPGADLIAATENDERITHVGRFLRSHYLDELPQFFNVFMGDMSVIGPRPHMLSDDENFASQIAGYTNRTHAKPGITGLSQVMGYAGPVADIKKMESRVRLDLYYIQHWSALLDCSILLRTIGKIIRSN